jgi:hypothetical protein
MPRIEEREADEDRVNKNDEDRITRDEDTGKRI